MISCRRGRAMIPSRSSGRSPEFGTRIELYARGGNDYQDPPQRGRFSSDILGGSTVVGAVPSKPHLPSPSLAMGSKAIMGKYSETLTEHVMSPRTGGVMEDPDLTGHAGAPGRGAFLILFLKVRDERVMAAKYHSSSPRIGTPPRSRRDSVWRWRRSTRITS